MDGLLETCRNLFGTNNLYDVLDIPKDSSAKDVKRGYHKVSLRVHPDRVSGDEKDEATKKFQTLGKVYIILSDKEKRAVYDETGEVDDENDIPQDRDWYDYWRILFRKITVDDIKEFEKEYKESEEELADLKVAYVEAEGDLDQVMDMVMLATVEDEPRFTKIIKNWIKNGDVPDFASFSDESNKKSSQRKRKAAKEAKEAEEAKERLGLGESTDSLKALIQKNKASREMQMDSFLSDLEAKYGQPKKGKTTDNKTSTKTKKTKR
ncbi:hypothetical protein ScPMuIL_013359 [Solemya velum]